MSIFFVASRNGVEIEQNKENLFKLSYVQRDICMYMDILIITLAKFLQV